MNEYMTRWNPLAECWSYVDDWQVTAHDAQDIIQGFQGLREFTTLLDIPMDDDKSAVWSTGSGDRRDFRQEALPVAYHGRNLGGHLTYCKTITNYTIKSRIAKQTELWTWLTKSYAPSPQKVLALIVVAWPRCLHGISINVLGAKHFTKLRTKAVQCLGDHRKGTSPILHLSCIQNPKADPEFFAIWITIKHFRGYSNPQVAFPIIDFLLHHKPIQERSGPCSIFLFRINQLGWTWKGGGAIEDHEQMPLHITNDPIQLLWARAKHAWWARTITIVSSRPGFSGLEHADVGTSVASLENFTSDQKQLLVVAMNGSFYTRDKLFATGAFPDRQCPWCDATDSQFHRHWECPHHQNSRDQIPPAIFRNLEGQAECMLEHGWCQDSPARICFQQKLLQQPDLTEEFFVEPPNQDIQHLFTDGSCLASGCPALRVATWGVVIAQLETDSFTPVAMGPLPGLYQTIFRAEATAYISACKFLLRHKIKGWIWSDNQQLVDFVKHAIIGCPIPNNKDPDHDILELVRQLTIRTFDRQLLQGIVKVRSHESLDAYDDVVQQWVIRGNDAADSCAARARQQYDAEFFTIWQTLAMDLQSNSELCSAVHSHMVRVGTTAVQEKSSLRQAVAVKWAAITGEDPPPREDDSVPVSWATIANTEYEVSTTMFGESVGVVINWLQGLSQSADSEVQWVTFYQLVVDFQRQTGQNGVRYNVVEKCWMPLTDWELIQEFPFTRVSQWFGTFLRSLAKKLSEVFHVQSARPTSTSFARWNKCLRISVPKGRMQDIDNGKVTV